MIAFINDAYKVVYVVTDDVGRASSIGVTAVRDHPDLFAMAAEGVCPIWRIYCVPSHMKLARRDRREGRVALFSELADALRRGSSPKPQPSGFVGPFGEGEVTG